MAKKLLEELTGLPAEFPGIFGIGNEKILYLLGCSKFAQFCSTLRGLVEPEQFCPFCTAERSRRARQFANTSGEWGLLENEFPHRSTEQMWLILPKRHLIDPAELTAEDWVSIGALFKDCLQEHEVWSGGLLGVSANLVSMLGRLITSTST